MTRKEIKRRIKGMELSYYALGNRWGVTSAMVSNFLNGKTHSVRLAEELAKLLEVKTSELPPALRRGT